MGRVRTALAATVLGAAIAAQGAVGADAPGPAAARHPRRPSPPPAQPAPPAAAPKPPKPKPAAQAEAEAREAEPARRRGRGQQGSGGIEPGDQEEGVAARPGRSPSELAFPAPASCGDTSVPAFLIPIYQRASKEYGLGPAGPSILAAINEIETGFGVNQGPSSAGAVGWMQFMPATWAAYGVDANGDGVKDPADPEDAIFAAARYLKASGMPEDPEGAIFAYNHADWYVADVLARAACFGGIGGGALGDLSLIPSASSCPAGRRRDSRPVPEGYLEAFQNAAARYDIGEDGVWALAAIARLESDYGRGMTPAELRTRGPLGIDEANWDSFAVDGDGDGKVQRESPGDSAATLGRMIWASGGLRGGHLPAQPRLLVRRGGPRRGRAAGRQVPRAHRLLLDRAPRPDRASDQLGERRALQLARGSGTCSRG